jgi:hypothetical protein
MILPGMLLPLAALRPKGVLGLLTHAREIWVLTVPETALAATTPGSCYVTAPTSYALEAAVERKRFIPSRDTIRAL